jgi:hypothetical protein
VSPVACVATAGSARDKNEGSFQETTSEQQSHLASQGHESRVALDGCGAVVNARGSRAMKFHSYSEIFPLIEGADFDALVADVKAHGLREKITLYEGKILDGRNRFLACQKAKVRPLYRKFTGKDALAFVVSLNIARRHLNASQLAMASARLATLRNGQRSDEVAGVSIETAATIVGASAGSTKRARQVLDKGSAALVRAVDSGEIPVSRAATVTDLPKAEQLAAAKEKPAKDAPELAEGWEPEPGEGEHLAALEKELAESVDKVMAADDKLATAFAEIKRQAGEIASLKLSRDGFMNGKLTITKLLKTEQRKYAKLQRENEDLRTKLGMPKRNGVHEVHA